MSKKNKKKYIITSMELFDFQKPKFNPYQGGYGPHGDKKYNRAKEKEKWVNLSNLDRL